MLPCTLSNTFSDTLSGYIEKHPELKEFVSSYGSEHINDKKFDISHLENLEKKAIQDLIRRNTITFLEGLHLSFDERMNLESVVIQSLIQEKELTIDAAKKLTIHQRLNLENPTIQVLIKQKVLNANTVLSLTFYDVIKLSGVQNLFDDFQNRLKNDIQKSYNFAVLTDNTFNTIKHKLISSFLQEKLKEAELSEEISRKFIDAVTQRITKENMLSMIAHSRPSHVNQNRGYIVKDTNSFFSPDSGLKTPLIQSASNPLHNVVGDDNDEQYSYQPPSLSKGSSGK